MRKREILSFIEATRKDSGDIGFMARSLLLATLPHQDPGTNEFVRINGDFRLTVLAPSGIGLPYGTLPRLLALWMTTEAVKTKRPELSLGPSLTSFLQQIGLRRQGGKRGDINRFRDQLKRLTSCSLSCDWHGPNGEASEGFKVVKRYELWSKAERVEQSKIILSTDFFQEITKMPVPINLHAVQALRRSCLALDIYVWLAHRLSYLKAPTMVPWAGLQGQFGVGYPNTAQGKRDFKKKFKQQITKVQCVYPGAKVSPNEQGVTLLPSYPSVRRRA